jgi:hypothetical protein
LDNEQAAVASTMVGVVIRRGLPERAAVLSIAASLQETKLRNLDAGSGDRDSVGVLQQRPSQGWGTASQLADIHYATGKFLDAVIKVPNWEMDSVATVVQKVQISADGAEYAKHERQSQTITDALIGATPAGVSCSFSKPKKVFGVATIAARLQSDLPVAKPVVSENSIQVPLASWATAAWFVAHASTFGINEVSYSGKSWTRAHGWRSDQDARADFVRASLTKI